MRRIQISPELAEWIAEGLRDSLGDLERQRHEALARLTDRRQRGQAKLDRGYDDYLEGRISQEFWKRKSAEWEAELGAVASELSRLSSAPSALVATGERILELAKTAHFRYQEQPMAEKRRLLDAVLSNCTFDRGSLCPAYIKPFDVLAKTVETGDWRGGRYLREPAVRVRVLMAWHFWRFAARFHRFLNLTSPPHSPLFRPIPPASWKHAGDGHLADDGKWATVAFCPLPSIAALELDALIVRLDAEPPERFVGQGFR